MDALLDWGDACHFDHIRNRPCALCGKPTPVRSHAGEPVHKVCAETWNAANPGESRRYTVPTKVRPIQRDVGTWRFHNDGPVTDQRMPVLGQRITTDSPPPVADEREQCDLFAA
ncbi:hypothetical protein ACFQ9J_13415 [Streptomyces sp. NPDC056529]|uniref:hypothetical protein n=1 Tax=Streptomyces sp. NPDC056529 TaxID=3345855 RepID=UPI0036C56BE3